MIAMMIGSISNIVLDYIFISRKKVAKTNIIEVLPEDLNYINNSPLYLYG